MFIPELQSLIEAAGIATGGTTFFNTSSAKVPIGDGPYLLVKETGGIAPDKTQNQTRPPAYVRPQAQVTAVGRDHTDTYRMIQAAYRTLIGRTNSLIGASALSVTLTRTGATVTATTAVPHNLASGYTLTVVGAGQAEYNGTFVITVTGDTTFTYTIVGTPTTPATGVITASYAGTWYRSIDAIQEPFNATPDGDERITYKFNLRADKVWS